MTTEQLPHVPENYISAMEEMAAVIQEQPNFRANVPAGTYLGRESIDGTTSEVRYQKPASKIRMGGVELPERIPLWNIAAQTMSMVPPTIAQSRVLKGTKQYPASAFTLRDPGLPKREPIPEGCPVCDRRRAALGQPPREFYDLAQRDAHFEILHPRAFRTEERRHEAEIRSQDQALMRELIASIRDRMGGSEDEAEEVAEKAIRRRRGGE